MVESAPSYMRTLPTPTVRARPRRYRSVNLQGTTMTATDIAAKITPSLQQSLMATVDALGRRRACDIPEQPIGLFSALRLREWRGGSLRLTEAGETLVVKVQSAMMLR